MRQRTHSGHNAAAHNLQQELSRVALPNDAQVIEEKSKIGGFISGTGDAIDALAYRVFISKLPETSVRQVLEPWAAQNPEGEFRGIFQLNNPETPQTPVTERFLRQSIRQSMAPAYVLYSAKRIDDGTWDWRGW